jgi:DNA repair protein RecN (Recombination protein N)
MIETLRIRGLAIVDEAVLEFEPGLNVLTGETGAGKSVVLGALGLLAGARAKASSQREGTDETSVEGVFRTEDTPDLEADLEAQGLLGDEHELVVHRSLTAAGRSRARVSGQLVPVATLNDLFVGRLEISSQHDSQSLRKAELHGRLLDGSGGLLAERDALGEAFRALRALDAERTRLIEAARDREQRLDFLGFQRQEIDEAKLDPSEIEELRALRSRLAHAERLRVDGGEALSQLVGDPLGTDAAGAADAVGEASRGLQALAPMDAELAAIGEQLESITAEIREAATDLERHLSHIEADPGRLAEIDERLHAVERLERKYGPGIEEVLRHRDAVAEELATLEGADAREAKIEQERAALSDKLVKRARKLSKARAKTAERLAADVESALRELAMPDARFAVELRPAPSEEGFPCGATGLELPEFVFTANAGEPLRPLRQAASGGELSRAFLAIKQALRAAGGGMVLVFDEVDAGIGGEAADRVGRQLAKLAAQHQVLCITHLPQIAAFANRHFRVQKRTQKGRTLTSIDVVEGKERVAEIARMAGGEKAGEGARKYARELLGAAAPR